MTRAELEDMTKDELIEYAEDMDVEVHHSWLKDEIISAVLKGQKAAANKTDSVKHLEERKASIQAENKQNEATAAEVAENQEIANFKGLPKEGETREQLLDRIRKMREEPPPSVPESGGMVAQSLIDQYEAEKKAGREAVAAAEKRNEDARKAREAAAAAAEGGKK
jgi:hypothetical protein